MIKNINKVAKIANLIKANGVNTYRVVGNRIEYYKNNKIIEIVPFESSGEALSFSNRVNYRIGKKMLRRIC